jgi:hypothetical protein
MDTFKNLRVFITASAMLAAVIGLWAQFWLNSIENTAEGTYNYVFGLALIWTFTGLIIDLLAIGYAAIGSLIIYRSNEAGVSDYAVGLFGTALIMTVFNILQSLVTVFGKTIANISMSSSMFTLIPLFGGFDGMLLFGLFLLAIFAATLIISLISAKKRDYLGWIIGLDYLILAIILFVIIFSTIALRIEGHNPDGQTFLWVIFGLSVFGFVLFSCMLVILYRFKARRSNPSMQIVEANFPTNTQMRGQAKVYKDILHEVIPDKQEPYYMGQSVSFQLRLTNKLNEHCVRKFYYMIQLPDGMLLNRPHYPIDFAPNQAKTIPLGDPVYLAFLGTFRLVIVTGEAERLLIEEQRMPVQITFDVLFAGYSRDRVNHDLQRQLRFLNWVLVALTVVLVVLTMVLILI